MGVTSLLSMLKDHLRYVAVPSLQGMKMGVDGYSWLYKAITVHASDVYLDPCNPAVVSKYVEFCVRKCKALMAHSIQLYFVFDGDEHPMKKSTNQKRRKRKMETQARIEALLKKGCVREAKALMSRCLKVDAAMVDSLMRALKEMGIPYMTAPYEADPQLVYLEREGYVDCITTEDSDLIVYGAKKVLFKLNEAAGGEMYNRDRILASCSASVRCLLVQTKEIVSLCGCDYTDGISGVGLITAHKLIMTHKTVLASIEYLCKKQGKPLMDHASLCTKVICTFSMHVVEDPQTGRRTYLGTPQSCVDVAGLADMSFLGALEPAQPTPAASNKQQ